MQIIQLALAVFTLVASCVCAAGNDGCTNVGPLEILLSEPRQHHGKRVCVAGVLNIAFEANGLVWGRSHVWLDFYHGPPWTDERIDRDTQRMNAWKQQYQGKCVVVDGIYNINDTGHMGMSPEGGIGDIVSIAAYQGICPTLVRAR